jgi:hypothetical protein
MPVVPTVFGVLERVCSDAHLHFRKLADKLIKQVCCEEEKEEMFGLDSKVEQHVVYIMVREVC